MERKQIVEEAFRTLLLNTDAMVFVKDIKGVYLAASTSFVEMTGKTSVEELIGRTDYDIFAERELAERYIADDNALLSDGLNRVNYIEPITDEHGHPRYSNTSKFVLKNQESGDAIGILGISRDVTHDYLARQRHRAELKYLFELPEDVYAALFMDIDTWRIIRHHSQPVKGFNVPVCADIEEFCMTALAKMYKESNPEAYRLYETLSRETMQELYNSGKRHHSLEYQRKMSGDVIEWVHVDIHFLVDPETEHQCAIWILRDDDVKKKEMEELNFRAEHDSLTGLYNRAGTDKYIRRVLIDYEMANHALFIIDVDNFKQINDTLGHQEGDAFLVQLGKLLQSTFRESDVVGRVGGDEFFVLMKNVPDELTVIEKAETLLSLCMLVCSAYKDLPISVSIGIGMYPDSGVTLEALYKHADRALYEAKRKKNSFVLA